MKSKYLGVLLAALVFLGGCAEELPAETERHTGSTYTAAEPIYDGGQADGSGVTAAEIIPAETEFTAVAETAPQVLGTYDLPPGFYSRFYNITDGLAHFNYYDISLAYCDLETGFRVMLNPDKHYYSASVIKAPYMLYIYRLALAGKADLEQKLTYTQKYRREGTGELKNMEFGTEFTVEELIGYCLETSDNSAFAMLKELYPEDGYEKFAASIEGVHAEDAKAKGGPQICCESSLAFSRAIYNFIGEKNPYSENLFTHMTNSRNAMIYGGEGSEVVRKYGWYEGFFHDMAIVYGEKNYLISIMTNLDMLEIDSREYGIFRDLSLLFAEYAESVANDDNGGDTVIIKIPKWEEYEMVLPKDPYMLLSVVNMKLRDSYKSLDELCEDMDVSAADLAVQLEKIGYAYSRELNSFAPIPKEPDPAVSASETPAGE
ncbi:MAG: serine hydrolase [Oscillospiraceae bacterium]|nr:serine hydrolase [Oscillospiraceae bacterium]